MKTLHKSQYEAQEFEPNEGQRGLLCSNRASLRCPSLSSNSETIPDETVEALIKLGNILKDIHIRMDRDGYEIINGKIQKKASYEQTNTSI